MRQGMMAGGAAITLALAACGEKAGQEAEAVASPPEAVVEPTDAGGAEAATFEATDYADMRNWLCHPDMPEGSSCDVPMDTTMVAADGSTQVEAFVVSGDAPIDCFYVYPTISADPGPNSDLITGLEEIRAVEQQFARFGQTCRLFAPMYRQTTIAELRRLLMTGTTVANDEMRYDDIRRAWLHYLDNDNGGRGVVLIGHSQGADMIQQLLARDIRGSAAEGRIVSVMPIGFNLYPDGPDGAYGPFEPCRTLGQTGCYIAYQSFRATQPPPTAAWFGQVGEGGQRAACVSPADIVGDGELDARYARSAFATGEALTFAEGLELETPFAALPGMISARCAANATHDWLEITVRADPSDPRTDTISGDVMFAGRALPEWGLHLVDINLAMGNLVAIVEAQAESWTASQGSGK